MAIDQIVCPITGPAKEPLVTALCDPPTSSANEHTDSPTKNPTPLPEPIQDLVWRIEAGAQGSDDRVIAAAVLVRELRQRIESGELGKVTWYEWAPRHIKLAKTRLKELMRIAEASDPHKEVQRLRELALERATRFRAKYKKRQRKLVDGI